MSVFEKPPRRDKQILIRVTAEEKERLEQAADAREMSIADLIREAVNIHLSRKKKKTSKKKRS